MSRILIYSDGSSKGNPGPGGWGAIVADEKNVRELGGCENPTTNNRMELRAVLEALRYVLAMNKDVPITLRTDSSYVIKGATLWAAGWQQRGWKTLQKEDVLSQDLWKPLLDLIERYRDRLTWEHVGGHVGIPGNERVDAIAQGFADGLDVELYDGSRREYGIDIESIDRNIAHAEKRARSRGAAYSYVSEIDGEVRVHRTWKECEARVKGKKARFRKTLSAEDEKKTIEEFSV